RLVLSSGKVINPAGLKTGGVPPYRETRGYVDEGLAQYRRLSGRRELSSLAVKSPRLILPAGRQPAVRSIERPEEIDRLKAGSIYLVDPVVGGSDDSIG